MVGLISFADDVVEDLKLTRKNDAAGGPNMMSGPEMMKRVTRLHTRGETAFFSAVVRRCTATGRQRPLSPACPARWAC